MEEERAGQHTPTAPLPPRLSLLLPENVGRVDSDGATQVERSENRATQTGWETEIQERDRILHTSCIHRAELTQIIV